MTQESAAYSPTDSEIAIPVDPEPIGLRVVQILFFLVGTVFGYLGALIVFGSETTCSPLALILGIGIGTLFLYLSDYLLRPRWSSNKYVELSQTQLDILNKGTQEQVIIPGASTDLHAWRFTVTRAGRVPKGTYMVGLAVEEEDVYLPVYCLIAPQKFDNMPNKEWFTELISRKKLRDAGGDTMRIAGLQRRLLKAETARSIHGVEMDYDDFLIFMEWLEIHFPEWSPSH